MAAGSDIVGERKKPATLQPGDVIWCRTVFGEEYEGEVMGYDESTQAVVIKKSQSKAIFDVSILNLKLVDQNDFELKEKSKGEAQPLPDLDKLKTERRLKTAKERVGIGVSPEGQCLFDFIRKTIVQCHWEGQNIMIFQDVLISPPYRLENCNSSEETGNSVNYIKQIMTKFYSESQTPAAQTAVAT